MNTQSAELSSRQRAHLRRLSHHTRPALHIGRSGVTPAAVRAVEEAFNQAELLKVKVLEGAPETARDTAVRLSEQLEGVQVVQVMGRIATLYRRHPERPRIELPH